jgi:DNA-directed RNA polymerase subunit D
MKVQLLAKTDDEMRLVIEETNPQFVNSLRRVMISEIPVLAIDRIEFTDNGSVLYDEMLAHRLGLLPLKFDQKAFTEKQNCDCEDKGCANCELVFILKKDGPCIVRGSDLKSADKEAGNVVFSDTPIVELFEGQSLKLKAIACLGKGREHAKFKSSNTYFRLYPTVKGKITNENEAIGVCSKHALSFSSGKPAVSVDCDLCAECIKIGKGDLKVEGDRTKFVFIIETISGMTAEQIFLSGLNVLKADAKDFVKQVGKVK